jgi:predicted DsbA family dithiol-disulfide isomerase
MQARLAKVGLAEGIAFSFDGKIGNTRDSHRLIELGKSKGEAMQIRVVEELFRGYFEGGADITDKTWLVERGVAAGLEEDEVRRFILESDAGGQKVDDEVAKTSRYTSGVPNFTVQDKYVVEGAEDETAFLQLFAEIADQQKS